MMGEHRVGARVADLAFLLMESGDLLKDAGERVAFLTAALATFVRRDGGQVEMAADEITASLDVGNLQIAITPNEAGERTVRFSFEDDT